MPFKSKAQMKAAFAGGLGPEMKSKAEGWAHETPNIKSLPEHVAHHSPPESYPTPIAHILKGESRDIMGTNAKSLMHSGMTELDATKKAIKASKGFSNPTEKVYRNQHLNLGKHLHPRKDGKPHGCDFAGDTPDTGLDEI